MLLYNSKYVNDKICFLINFFLRLVIKTERVFDLIFGRFRQ